VDYDFLCRVVSGLDSTDHNSFMARSAKLKVTKGYKSHWLNKYKPRQVKSRYAALAFSLAPWPSSSTSDCGSKGLEFKSQSAQTSDFFLFTEDRPVMSVCSFGYRVWIG
jgi:hypothetical protein